MIRKIELTNYMSHSHTVIEPADGLTVLIGENNCGKSAVVSALQTLCRNAHGDYMVRHGERECSVAVETDDGHTVVWQRSGNTVSYTIDGCDISRLHGKIPDSLHDILKLPLVETDGPPFDIHFGEQKKPIFLLDETANRRATFFASSSDSAKLLAIQNLHNRKIRDAKAREREIAATESRLAGRLKSLESVDDMGQRLGKIETDFETIAQTASQTVTLLETITELGDAESAFDQWFATVRSLSPLSVPPEMYPIKPLRQVIDEIEDASARVARERAKSAALAKLSPAPELLPTEALRDLIGQLASAEYRVRFDSALRSATDPLSEPPRMWDTDPLFEIINEIRRANLAHLRLGRQVVALYGLGAPPEFGDTQSLASLIADICKASADTVRLRQHFGVLSRSRPLPEFHDTKNLKELVLQIEVAKAETAKKTIIEKTLTRVPEPPQIINLSEIREMIEQFENMKKEIDDLERHLDNVKNQMKQTERELRKCAEDTGTCPTCGRELDADQMLVAAAGPL